MNVPGLTQRESATTVRLRDGQSFAIAGLLSDRMRNTVSKLPLLGDIPVLGALFRSSSFRRDETELVILITPVLVKPVRDRGLATPLDRPAPLPPPGPTLVKAKPLPEPNSGFVFK